MRRIALLFGIAYLSLIVGCGKHGASISGIVTLDGEPLKGVQILFDQPSAADAKNLVQILNGTGPPVPFNSPRRLRSNASPKTVLGNFCCFHRKTRADIGSRPVFVKDIWSWLRLHQYKGDLSHHRPSFTAIALRQD